MPFFPFLSWKIILLGTDFSIYYIMHLALEKHVLFPLVLMVFNEKSTWIFVPLQLSYSLSQLLWFFSFFQLQNCFVVVVVMCLLVDIFGLTLIRSGQILESLGYVFYNEVFSIISSSSFFRFTLILFSSRILMKKMFYFCHSPSGPWDSILPFSLPFFYILSLCSDYTIFIILFSNSLIFSSFSFILLLILSTEFLCLLLYFLILKFVSPLSLGGRGGLGSPLSLCYHLRIRTSYNCWVGWDFWMSTKCPVIAPWLWTEECLGTLLQICTDIHGLRRKITSLIRGEMKFVTLH